MNEMFETSFSLFVEDYERSHINDNDVASNKNIMKHIGSFSQQW